jgi:3-oxoacyl-[acyl-carrier-protein] synthase I
VRRISLTKAELEEMTLGSHARPGYPATSWSAINSLGSTTAAFRAGLRRGAPAFSAMPAGTPFEGICGAVDPNLPSLPEAVGEFDSRNSRFIYHALAELEGALSAARARWGNARIGICAGSSTAAMDEIEAAFFHHAETGAIPPDFDVLTSGSADGLLRVLRAVTHFGGPATVVSNACASSGKAFATARRWLDADLVDAVLVGGADSLCQMTLRGFRSLGLLCEGASRPFSRDRAGINIGEGAAFALLEREGEGPRLLGAGESSDAHHMTRPDPEGKGARRAMEAALASAGVRAEDVGYINAHGTGTHFNDAMEAQAIRDTVGGKSDPLVVSNKGYIGHTLGAAGAMGAICVLEALQDGWIPASAGADPADPELGLNVPSEAVDVDLRIAMCNAFAFGGSNVSLVFEAPR